MALSDSTPEDRLPFYEDLEQGLNPGFLYQPVTVNGSRLVLRNPTRADVLLTRARSASDDPIEWQRWWVATCTWMVNGQILLGSPNAAYHVYQELQHVPVKSFSKIFWTLLALRNRFTRALNGLETYCFEGYSRQRWHALGGQPVVSEAITGIPGTSSLGTNSVQQLWVIYNVLEDARMADERQWLQLRATMSPHLNKKSWDHLISADRSTENRRQEDRQRESDLFYYRSLGVLGWDEDFVDLQGAARFKRKNVKDLQQEFYSWVAGERDDHDLIIDSHKQRIRQTRATAMKVQEDRRKRAEELFSGQSGVTSRVKMMGYTPAQLAELMKNKPRRNPNMIQVNDPSKSEYLYDRYMKEDPSPGALEVVDGVLQVHHDKRETLQTQVANRRVSPDVLEQWE